MILVLDVGNTQIHGGIYVKDKLQFQFRTHTKNGITSDDLGVFLRNVLRENGFFPEKLKKIAICSVVPDLLHSIRSCVTKYFKADVFFLQAGVKTGLKIKYRNPIEVGADRIANAVAAIHLYPQKNIIVIDFGTATTICAITENKEYLGGLILPGIRISMEVLDSQTARLPKVEIMKPKELVGKSTTESIQSGLYYGQLLMTKSLSRNISEQYFENKDPVIITTGGFARLYEEEDFFDIFIPDLVLKGLYLSLKLNS